MEITRNSKIFVAGHLGLLGSALVEELRSQGYSHVLTATRDEVDLTDQKEAFDFLKASKPDVVFCTAARVGGIAANSKYPAEFIYQNLQIQNNLFEGSHLAGVGRLIYTASNCAYPKETKQPMKEEQIMTGPLEPTNEAYAYAKLAGIGMCKAYSQQYKLNYTPVVPCSLYGPNDNFDPEASHVFPAMLAKFHRAKVDGLKEVTMWGTGKPRRELMHSRDGAKALIFIMNKYLSAEPINVGMGFDFELKELVEIIKDVTGFSGQIQWDTSKKDGMFQKLLDSTKMNNLGFKPSIDLKTGAKQTYEWFISSPKVRGWKSA